MCPLAVEGVGLNKLLHRPNVVLVSTGFQWYVQFLEEVLQLAAK